MRISNGLGGSGPYVAPGFAYDPNGGTNWVHPADPGDGSLFRTDSSTPPPSGQCSTTSNIATSGSAVQSSTHSGGFVASYAIDGNLGNFTHTVNTDTNPTWTLTLAQNSIVESVVLHNRDSCCALRLRDITVSLLDQQDNVVYASSLLNPENTLNSPDFITVDLPSSSQGVKIRVQRTPDPDFSGGGSSADDASVLSLGEVQVNGCVAP